MSLTRRQALASGAAAIAGTMVKPAIAAKEPILIGYLPALTGPSSSTGVGINRGIQLAVQEINAAGGIDGRQIELITRDTQSDPTKAVNATAELTRAAKVGVVFGPLNSGESLAVVPILARQNTLQIHPCWVDSLTDVKKYPMCFRNAPTCGQTTLGSGQTQALLEKPEYWSKVYPNNFAPVCYDSKGKLPDRAAAFVDRLRAQKISMADTLLWWIGVGYDTPYMMAEAM